MKKLKFAGKPALLYACLFVGYFAFPQNSFAQCSPWVDWRIWADNYYTSDIQAFLGLLCGGCVQDPPSHIESCEVYIDGLWNNNCDIYYIIAGPLTEGVHSVVVSGTIRPYNSPLESFTIPAKEIYVDNTPPAVALTYNAVMSTADISIIGSVSDTASKLGVIDVILSASPCRFKRDLFDSPVAAFSIRGRYCSALFYEHGPNVPPCDANIGTTENFAINRNLTGFMDLSQSQDCQVSGSIYSKDHVGNSTYTTLNFIIDQLPPVIYISTWPVSFAVSTPAVAGMAADSSEIKYVKLKLLQRDWRGIETYWNGADWTADDALLNVNILQSTNTLNWGYTGLTGRDMISGSHYKLTVYAADKFDHVGTAEQEFDYDACAAQAGMAPIPNTPQKFEVGDAVFRKKSTMWPLGSWIGHTGVYVVSDANYQQGQSADVFVADLKSKGTLRAIAGSDMRHYIVQAGGPGKTVESVSLDGFMLSEPQKYWGAKTTGAGIDAERRDQIAYNAAIQLGKDYKFFKNWASGEDLNNPVGFRCDGLVVYSYEKAGIAEMIEIAKNSWIGITPRKLLKLMADSQIDYPAEQDLTISDAGDNFRISLAPRDAGSGIDRVEYYLYTLNGEGIDKRELLRDDADSVGQQVRASTCACNPGGNLVTRLVDRAGNWAVYDYSRTELENSGGGTASVIIGEDQPPVMSPPVIKTENSCLAAVVSGISDDSTPLSNMVLLYKVDVPFANWDDDGKVAVLSPGMTSGNFAALSGTHKLYSAVMDESFNFAVTEKEFRVPGLAYASLGGGARAVLKDVGVEFDNLTSLASVSANNAAPEILPPGYSHLPQPLSKELTIDGAYQGGFRILISYAASGVTPGQEPYLQILHNNRNITIGLDRHKKLIAGYADSASPFTVAVSTQLSPETALPDVWPPLTAVETYGGKYLDGQERSYISTTTLIGLNAEDNRAGTRGYYALSMTESLFEAGLVPASLGQFTLYLSSFTAPEGARWIGYGSVDTAGNYELLKTATFYVDGTPPAASLWAGSGLVADTGTAYITEGGSITLSAADPESNGVSSGINDLVVVIDINPSLCRKDPVFEGPAGTCENPRYSGPFSLETGTHTVYYRAVDNVGNKAGVKSALITVGPVDIIPPVTEVRVEGRGYRAGDKLFVTSGTIISLSAYDDAGAAGDRLGVAAWTSYSVDSDTFSVYAGTFSIANEGEHSVRFYSVDMARNVEAVRISSITVDNTAPVTTPAVNGLGVTAPAVFITAGDSIILTAIDGASGTSAVWYFVDSGTATAFADAFTLGAGTHSITYWSVDNVGNAEAAKTVRILAGTAPVKLNLEPETLNLGSKGEVITARLTVENGKALCFNRAGIKISAINGQELGIPIYALPAKGGDDDRCGSITVKFDREAVIAVLSSFAPAMPPGASKGRGPAKLLLSEADLPANASVKVTMSGEFAGGYSFSADGIIKTIKPSADPAFRLGEVYVLPNPAMGGAKPVFHIETGIADSVKLTIRTVSGMVVHEHTLTGLPRTLNKGGNLVYVYEYAWEGNITGGVYSYVMEAEKAGQKLQKSGMFAVMR